MKRPTGTLLLTLVNRTGLAVLLARDEPRTRVAQLRRRRARADVVWMVGLLLASGFFVFAFVGGGVRSRLTRAKWDLDRDNAPNRGSEPG